MQRSLARSPLFWLAGILVVGLAIGLAMTALPGEPSPAQAAEAGSIPFSHQVHVEEAGVQCLFCHSQALRAPQASLPSLQTCMTCHEYITVDEDGQELVQQVVQAYESGARVQWPDVYKQPDFVRFSHRAHLAGGVACQTCHGPVEEMGIVEKRVEMNMGFCLDCHRAQIREHPEMAAMEKARLLDCTTCHK